MSNIPPTNHAPHHRRFLPPPKKETAPVTVEPSLCEKILRLFCCCCFKPPQPKPETQPQLPQMTFNFMGFETVGEGEYRHASLPASRSHSLIFKETETETLVRRLNASDYTQVRACIEDDAELLSKEKKTKALELLSAMQETEPFLDPNAFAVRIKNFPEEFLNQIRSRACLAAVYEKGKSLAYCSVGLSSSPRKNLITSLEICFGSSCMEVFEKYTGRFPSDILEQVDCIRWGALHRYDVSSMPQSIRALWVKKEEEEIVLEHKGSFSEPLSPTSKSILDLPKDTSTETVSEESMDSQFFSTSSSLEQFRDEDALKKIELI